MLISNKTIFSKREQDESIDSPISGASIIATPEIKRKRRKRNSGSYPDYSKRRKKPNVKNANSPSNDKTAIVNVNNVKN